jgi:hypothetical protein
MQTLGLAWYDRTALAGSAPKRVPQHQASHRQAERVVCVHHVRDEAKVGTGVEEGEGGGSQRMIGVPRLWLLRPLILVGSLATPTRSS